MATIRAYTELGISTYPHPTPATVDVLEQLAAAFAIESAELLQGGTKAGSPGQVLSE